MALIINIRGQRLNLPAGTERKLEMLVEGEEMMRGFFFFFAYHREFEESNTNKGLLFIKRKYN